MTMDQRPFEEMNTITKQIKDQALVATDDYFNFLKKTVCSGPSRGTELDGVLKSYAVKNIDAAREYVHKLSEAKDFQDALRVQTEFMQYQFARLGEQTKDLGEAYSKSAASVFNTSYKNVA